MTLRGRSWLLLFLSIVGVSLTARLGVWQLDRAAQKVALQQAVERQGELPPLEGTALSTESLASSAAGQAQLHRRVRLMGRWLPDKTVFLDNRPMQGRAGFFVVTPLLLEGRPEAILVQRAWVPRNMADRSALPALPTVAGVVTVEGRLAASPSRLYEFSPAHSGVIRQNLEAAAYAQEIKQGLLPLTVIQTGGAPADDLLRDWPAPDLGLQKHYGYAFQWFALSALILGLYVWFQFLRPARRAA
nr:SURF1 family protein [Roseateles koreensis]